MLGATLVVVHGAVARGTARANSKLNLIVVAASDLPFQERDLRSGFLVDFEGLLI